MKKFSLSLLLLLSVITACKKDEGKPTLQDNNENTYKVSFNIDSFDRSVDNFKSNIARTSDHGPYPWARVYNLATPWDFGIDFHHSLELAPGNYVALFVSGNFSERYGIGRSAPRVTYGDAYFDTKENIVMADLPISEFFYKKVFFTVTNKDIRQTVVLDRITAGLEVELQDVLPPNVYVNITVHDATTYSFKTDTRGGGYRKMYYRNPYTLISNVLNAGPTKVTITAVDERNNVLATKDVIATFVPNRKTKLIGKLFSPVSFTVHANLEWDAPGPTVQF